MKPVFDLSRIIHQLTTSWGGGQTHTRSWSGTSAISYALPDAAPTNGGAASPDAAGIVALTPHQKAQAELAFALWDDLIPQAVTETRSSAANIVFDATGSTAGAGSHTTSTLLDGGAGSDRLTSGQVWIDATWTTDRDENIVPESYGFLTYMHEIGHSLGLSHPGTYDSAAARAPTFAQDAAYSQDNRRYSLMSYFGGYDPASNGWTSDGTVSSWLYPDTPMVDDIAAIQSLYGADTTTRSGDTTYGFHCSLAADDPERSIYDFSIDKTPILTIWDAGGTDTLDCSGYSGRQVISLAPGSYSSVDGLTDNVAIAFGSTLERAVGGSGDDVLVSGGSAQTLTGGAGSDTFRGSAADLRGDVITDFSGLDRIDVTDLAYRPANPGATAAPGGTEWRYDAATGLFTVDDAASPATTAVAFSLPGVPAGAAFTLGSDGASGTSIALTSAAAMPIALGTAVAPAAAAAPSVAFDGTTAGFVDGRTPVLTGSVSAGTAGVELFDGDPAAGGRDLGAATVDDDGTWRFSADLGRGDFAALTAVATDRSGRAASAAAPYELVTGLVGLPYRAVEYDVGAGGDESYIAYGRRGAVRAAGSGRPDGAPAVSAAASSGQIASDATSGATDHRRFVFEPGFGHDAVTDFRVAGRDHDVLDLSATPLHGIAELLGRTSMGAGSATIHLDRDDTITLQGVSKAQLMAHPDVFALAV